MRHDETRSALATPTTGGTWMLVASMLLMACASSRPSAAADAAGTVPAAGPPLPVLIVDGQNNHDWRATTPVLREILEASGRFAVTVATSPPAGAALDGFRPPFRDHEAVVLNYNGAAWPPATRNDFLDYVRAGGGVVVVHAANNAFPDWPEFNDLIGLGGWGGRDERSGPYLVLEGDAWTRDPSPGIGGAHGPQYAFAVETRAADHPVMRGLPPVWMHVQDELYSHLRGPARNMTVLATAYSAVGQRGSGRHEPVIFTVEFGRGRVFHTVLGHATYSMRCTGFSTTLARGTEWAATGRVTLPVPADFPTATRTRGRGDTSITSGVRPPLPPWPPLPVPAEPPRDPAAGDQAGAERDWAAGMRFCWCPTGSFLMGSQLHEDFLQADEQTRVVTFPRGFWLAKHEVTRTVWRAVMETTPWAAAGAARAAPPPPPADADAWPATHVTWDNAAEFCRRLTDREAQAGRLPAGWEYRLPTEAEWEYGCRAGSQARFSFGDREADLVDHGWFAANTVDEGRNHPQPVGRKRPNAWGLCDMHGNVWEWCRDTYEAKKAFRGGCWANIAWWCRSADRNALPPACESDMLGFRIALAPREP
jgi:formylglycine-generating enzyme required for sulfatase activity